MIESLPSFRDRLPAHLLRCVCAGLCAGALATDVAFPVDEPEASDSILPRSLNHSDFEALRTHSPFTRSLSLSDSILLTGVAEIDGSQVATLFDKESRVSYVVSETPNAQGWKMVGIDRNQELDQVSATISVDGGEIVTVRFSEGQLQPGEGKPAATAVPSTPRGEDRRSLPTDEERRKFGEWLKKRMSNFSDQQKRKAGEIMQEKMKANPQMSDRQKGEVFVQILDYVEANQ